MSKMEGMPGDHSEHFGFVVKNDRILFRRGREISCKISRAEHLHGDGRSLLRSAWFVDLLIDHPGEIIFSRNF